MADNSSTHKAITNAQTIENLKAKQPKVFSRMGKATESSFNILKPKGAHDGSDPSATGHLSKPKKHKLGDPLAPHAKDRAINMFFEQKDECERYVTETRQ